MPPTTVVHCHKKSYDVFIGRPSPRGNKYKIGKHGTRREVVEKFEKDLRNDPARMALVKRHLRH